MEEWRRNLSNQMNLTALSIVTACRSRSMYESVWLCCRCSRGCSKVHILSLHSHQKSASGNNHFKRFSDQIRCSMYLSTDVTIATQSTAECDCASLCLCGTVSVFIPCASVSVRSYIGSYRTVCALVCVCVCVRMRMCPYLCVFTVVQNPAAVRMNTFLLSQQWEAWHLGVCKGVDVLLMLYCCCRNLSTLWGRKRRGEGRGTKVIGRKVCSVRVNRVIQLKIASPFFLSCLWKYISS